MRYLVAILVTLFSIVAAPARANDNADCGDTLRLDLRIVACSRLLEKDDPVVARSRHVYFNNRASAYFALGRYDDAIADGDAALAIMPTYTLALNNRGNAWLAKGSFERAMADFNAAIRLDPGFAEAFYNRGNAYLSRHKLSEATADYTRAIERDGRHVGALNNRAIVHERLGDRGAALADYERALAVAPDSPSIAANLARLRGKP